MRHTRRGLTLTAGLAGLALVAAGCGSGDSDESTEGTSDAGSGGDAITLTVAIVLELIPEGQDWLLWSLIALILVVGWSVRDLFAGTPEAVARAFAPGRFSFNTAGGRCASCQGMGYHKVEMQFMADVEVPCEDCEGRRFNAQTLEVKYRGLGIAAAAPPPGAMWTMLVPSSSPTSRPWTASAPSSTAPGSASPTTTSGPARPGCSSWPRSPLTT